MRKLEEGPWVCPPCGYDSSQYQNPEKALPEGTILPRKYLLGDVYALCATMYHAIKGILLSASIERNIDGAPLKTFEECNVSVPQTIERAIVHGMALKSTERTQTMGQLLRELKGEDTADFREDKIIEQKAGSVSEAKTYHMTQNIQPEKQRETSLTQTGAIAQGKSEKKSSVVPKFLAGVIAEVLLVIGIYFGFLRGTDKSGTKPETPKETVTVSTEPAAVPTPTATPTLTLKITNGGSVPDCTQKTGEQ